MRRRTDHVAGALLACGLVAALLYSNFLLDWTHGGFIGMDDIASLLEAPGEPHAMLLRTTDVVCALLVVTLLPWVRDALPRGPWREITVGASVLFALGASAAAFMPPPCGPDVACAGHHLQIAVHNGSSLASDAALYVGAAAAWFASREAGPRWFHRAAWSAFWVGGVLSSVVFAYFKAIDDPAWAAAVSQRAHIVCISAWILCLALLAARGRALRHPPTDRHIHEEHDHVHTH